MFFVIHSFSVSYNTTSNNLSFLPIAHDLSTSLKIRSVDTFSNDFFTVNLLLGPSTLNHVPRISKTWIKRVDIKPLPNVIYQVQFHKGICHHPLPTRNVSTEKLQVQISIMVSYNTIPERSSHIYELVHACTHVCVCVCCNGEVRPFLVKPETNL